MATIWTPEEYSRVAVALLYPGFLPSFLAVGASYTVYQLTRKLDVALQQLTPEVKALVLNLCGEVESLEGDIAGVNSTSAGLQDPSVSRVDKITLDPLVGMKVRTEQAMHVRARISAIVGVETNPESPLGGSNQAGGINAAIC